MKRLIALILSAALLCPMLAGAASTSPTVTGPIIWGFTGYDASYNASLGNIPPTTVPLIGGGAQTVDTVQFISVNITNPQNTEGNFSISGNATVYLYGVNGNSQKQPSIPVTGSMISILSNSTYSGGANALNTAGYMATFYIGNGIFTCTISGSTLNGTCVNSSGLPFSILYGVF